jgi:hypothetical protein
MELLIFLYLFLREKPLCFYSSFVFLINTFFCFLRNKFLYGMLFLVLFSTSVFFYTYNDLIPFLLDKITILMVVLYGGIYFLMKKKRLIHSLIAIFTFFMTIFLFYYGYLTENYCYGEYSDFYHSFLHILSSVGHLAVLFM